MKINILIAGRVGAGVLILIVLHLFAFRLPETWSSILFWTSFVAVGVLVGKPASHAFARGLITSFLGFLCSWSLFTNVLAQIPDERDLFAVFAFMLPVVCLFGGVAAAVRGWTKR